MRPTKSRYLAVLVALLANFEAHAYLGGFEYASDGYLGFTNWVNGYDAGQTGTANGGPGGLPTNGAQPPSANISGGLWVDQNNAFTTYNAQGPLGGYYVTGHTPVAPLGMFPHSGSQMLAVRNTGYASQNIPAQPLDYSYTIDNRDYYNGGNPINPAATGNKIVNWGIWISPGPKTKIVGDGLWLSFRDSVGSLAFQFGWDESYELRYRDDPSKPWINTGYFFGRPWGFPPPNPFPPNVYDHLEFEFDLLNDAWSLVVFSGLTQNTTSLVGRQPFGTALQNLTGIDFHAGYGAEKSFFDDSTFVIRDIPEPGSLSLLGLGCLFLLRTRRKPRWRLRVAAAR